MAWLIPQSTTNLGGAAVNLGAADSVFVAAGVTVASTAGTAIFGNGNNHQALIYGTVAGTDFYTIGLGGSNVSSGQVVTVTAGGHVQGLGVGYAIAIFGFASGVTNEGLISSLGSGILMQGDNAATTSTTVNSGTIEARVYGVVFSGTEKHALTNSGLISGGFLSYSGADSRDVITNTGRMVGDIQLNGGNDTYNGASGRLTGTVFGGAGNDTITGGIDNDRFEGGNDNDTLRGGKGNDTLFGDAGNDILNGGLGNDKLYGGANNDAFVFNAPLVAANRDTIYDFNAPQDTIHLENAIFKALTRTGVLNKDFFKLGTKATDANDHIIYNKATGALFYDPDGTGAAAQVQFATLANKPAISHLDFQII